MSGSRAEAEEGDDGLLGTAVRQTGWSTVEKVANQGLRFVFLVALARLLQPEAFGLLTEAAVVTALLGTGAALGLEVSLVQSDEAEGADFTTAAWASAALAVGLVVAALLLSPVAAWIFGSPALRAVVPVAALGPALRNLALSPRADLRRRMRFRPLAISSFTGTVAGGMAAVLMAYRGYGVWSLVAQLVVDALVTSGGLWSAARIRLAPTFSLARLERLARFGGPYTGEQLLNFVNRRADDLVIGVFLGETALGFYRIAYTALRALTRVLSGSLTAVALPLFSRSSSDRDLLRERLLTATEYAGLVSIPACAGFVVLADVAIPAFYGGGWGPAVAPARILGLVALVDSLLLFSPTAMYSLGRSDLQLRLTGLYAGVNAIGFLIGVRWGIVGVAAAYALQTVLTAPVELGVLRSLVRFGAGEYLRRLWRPAVAALVMCGAVAGGRAALDLGAAGELVFGVALGVAVYGAALFLTGPTYVSGVARRFLTSAEA